MNSLTHFFASFRSNLTNVAPSFSSNVVGVIPVTDSMSKMSHNAFLNTLGNLGNITDCALTGQKRYRWEENAFAPPGRNHHTA